MLDFMPESFSARTATSQSKPIHAAIVTCAICACERPRKRGWQKCDKVLMTDKHNLSATAAT